jgi:hypothetical protein
MSKSVPFRKFLAQRRTRNDALVAVLAKIHDQRLARGFAFCAVLAAFAAAPRASARSTSSDFANGTLGSRGRATLCAF